MRRDHTIQYEGVDILLVSEYRKADDENYLTSIRLAQKMIWTLKFSKFFDLELIERLQVYSVSEDMPIAYCTLRMDIDDFNSQSFQLSEMEDFDFSIMSVQHEKNRNRVDYTLTADKEVIEKCQFGYR